jgi:hypothetical protein
VLYAVKGDLTLIDFFPSWVQAVVVPLIPTAITAVAGESGDTWREALAFHGGDA